MPFHRLALALGIVAAAAPGSRADEAARYLTLPAYLHDGPGRAYAVIDELDVTTPVRVGDCGGDWCAVVAGGRAGYLPRALLDAGAPDAVPAAADACFDAQQAGHGAGRAYRYCAAQSRKP